MKKIKVLRSVAPFRSESIVLGQYSEVDCGRRPRLSRGTRRSELAHGDVRRVKLYIDTWRWQGVPFVLRTGKRLTERLTQIAVKFRRPPVWMFTPLGSPDDTADMLLITATRRRVCAVLRREGAGGSVRARGFPLDSATRRRSTCCRRRIRR